jgi:hypothetical protein
MMILDLIPVPRLMELRWYENENLAGETEVLGGNLPQRYFVITNPTCSNHSGGKPATNRLSPGAAYKMMLVNVVICLYPRPLSSSGSTLLFTLLSLISLQVIHVDTSCYPASCKNKIQNKAEGIPTNVKMQVIYSLSIS